MASLVILVSGQNKTSKIRFMKHFILQCEVGKENQILPYCDAIILGTNEKDLQELMFCFHRFEVHFEGLSVGVAFLGEDPEMQLGLIRHCIQRGSKVLLLGAEVSHYQQLSQHIEQVHLISNRISWLDLPNTTHCLGFQRHLVSAEDIQLLEQRSMDSASLGLLTEDLNAMEPILRSSVAVHVDASVCKSAFAPDCRACEPSGLSPEELIQMVRFASHSPGITLIGFDTTAKELKSNVRSPMMDLYATAIWYFIEGLQQGPFLAATATEITFVNLQDYDEILEFAHDPMTQRWWVRVQQEESKAYLACTRTDHEEAVKGSVTHRLHRYLFEN